MGVSRLSGVRNEEVSRRAGKERGLSGGDQRVLGWFGCVGRMDVLGLAKRQKWC